VKSVCFVTFVTAVVMVPVGTEGYEVWLMDAPLAGFAEMVQLATSVADHFKFAPPPDFVSVGSTVIVAVGVTTVTVSKSFVVPPGPVHESW